MDFQHGTVVIARDVIDPSIYPDARKFVGKRGYFCEVTTSSGPAPCIDFRFDGGEMLPAAAFRLEEQKTPSLITLRDPRASGAQVYANLVDKIALEGKPFIIAGLSLEGARGYLVRLVGIYQGLDWNGSEFKRLIGWSFADGRPGWFSNGLRRVGTKRLWKGPVAIPNLMVYFVAEADPELCGKNIGRTVLQDVIDYALTYIHD